MLSVLFMVALVTFLSLHMAKEHRRSMDYTHRLLQRQQALQQLLISETWVRALLYQDFMEDLQQGRGGARSDSLQDIWADPEPAPGLVQGSGLDIRVRDLGGLLNLNHLHDRAQKDRLRRLLTALGLSTELADVASDWRDADIEPAGGGVEDDQYLLMQPAYRAANGALHSVTELRLLHGINAETYRKLLPHVTTLPEEPWRTININTAPAAVLAALAPGSTADSVRQFQHPDPPWNSIRELIATEVAFTSEAGMLAVHSDFFEMLARVTQGEYTLVLRSRIYRNPETGLTQVLSRDLARNFNTWPPPQHDVNGEEPPL